MWQSFSHDLDDDNDTPAQPQPYQLGSRKGGSHERTSRRINSCERWSQSLSYGVTKQKLENEHKSDKGSIIGLLSYIKRRK